MRNLLYFAAGVFFGSLTDVSSTSYFNGVFCPIAAFVFAAILFVKLMKWLGVSGGPGSGGGGFFDGTGGGDCGGGDGGGC